MEKIIISGDVVKSISGRDKGKYFLVIEVTKNYAMITDGRLRKVKTPKKKNIKHLEVVSSGSLKELSDKILKGYAVGNENVYRAVRAEKQKIQED